MKRLPWILPLLAATAAFSATLSLLLAIGSEARLIAQEQTRAVLYQLKVVEPGYDVAIVETQRGPTYSVLDTKGLVPTVTAAGMVMMRAVYDIGKQRGFAYAFTGPSPQLPRGDTSRGSEGRRIASIAKVFFTNDPKTPLKDLLGTDYSEEAQQLFDSNGYISLSQFERLFGGGTPGK